MPFANKNNRITVKGFLTTDIMPDKSNDFAITFDLKVARPHEAGKKEYYDVFTIYVADRQNIANCQANLVKGMSVSVTGELRKWFDGTYKICVNKINPIW